MNDVKLTRQERDHNRYMRDRKRRISAEIERQKRL